MKRSITLKIEVDEDESTGHTKISVNSDFENKPDANGVSIVNLIANELNLGLDAVVMRSMQKAYAFRDGREISAPAETKH
jgi:hypothetical protein